MQAPILCPEWEYKEIPRHDSLLAQRNRKILSRIRQEGDPIRRIALMKDTRSIHGALFEGLTPAGHSYYAGNYRGDLRYPCLATYEVGIEGNPAVGHASDLSSPYE